MKKILILVDFSEPSRAAMKWALRLAERFGSRLLAAHALQWEEGAPPPEAVQIWDNEIRAETEGIARGIEQASGTKLARPETLIIPGKPVQELLKLIGKEAPDLVVMGSHGRTGLSHVLLGSVAERIVRHSPSPVLVARGAPTWPVKSVLVPVDFSEFTEEALLLASELQGRIPFRAEILHVLSVQDVMLYHPETAAALPPPDLQAVERRANERMEEILKRHPKLTTGSRLRTGFAANEICREAKESGTDLILIPTHGRTGIAHFFLGSIAEHVIRYAPCSVLSFCPKKFAGARLGFR